MKFKYAFGTAPGISGIGHQAEHQDRIGFNYEDGVTVITLTDPAGAAGNAGLKAKLAADTAAALMIEHFERLCFSDDEVIKKAILDNLADVFQRAGKGFSGTEGTLIFVAVKDRRYLAGHLGGGLIAKLSGDCSVLSVPDMDLLGTGNEAETGNGIGTGDGNGFSAEDRIMKDLRIYTGELQEPFGFMLMSDGACSSLFESGTGILSPACSTFFQWLKEYDGETVSEALVDNINKYFKKDIKDDIIIALMVPDEDAEEETAESAATAAEEVELAEELAPKEIQPSAEPAVSGAAKKKKYLRYIIAAAVIVIAAVVLFFSMNPPADVPEKKEQAKADPKPPVTETADYEPSVTFAVENPVSYDAGEYQVGDDIPAGEYFFWTGDMLKPDSVAINGDTCLSRELYCMTIVVGDQDTLTSEYRFTAAENVNPVEATNGTLISGKYKIGKDIMPGEYLIKPADQGKTGRYYSVSFGEIENDTEISSDVTVTVPEEGYAVFYDAILTVEQ